MDVTRAHGHPITGSLTMAPAAPHRLHAIVIAVVLAVVVAATPGLVATADEGGRTYVLDASAVLPAGAQIIRAMPFIGAVVVSSPVDIPGAAAMDTPARTEALVVESADGILDTAVASTGAPHVWATGERGRQAVVALIDTGVAPVPALLDAVAGEIDFTGTGGGDGFGHGTFMASIIAGRGTVATGVAPEAGVLSLKVGAADGSSTLGTILTALEWLHGPGHRAGIKVAALAMAVDAGTPAARMLDRAVDRVASRGVLVVAAAGNDGPGALTSPATARASFSIGAVDDAGTADRGDDVVAAFSGTGPDAAGVPQPDAVASGVDVVGSLPPDSVIAATATATPEGLYSGSGTSMSTAVAAGVAALASSSRPDLDGAALDRALRAGAGALDAPASVATALAASSTPCNNGNGKGNGNGNCAGNGNGNGGVGNGNGNGNAANPQSIRWTSIRWTSIRWTGAAWGDHQWGMESWGSIRWTGKGWGYADAQPQSIRWTSIRWTWLS